MSGNLEVLLVHPGGPFWAGKDDRSWSIPKGEFTETENPLEAAKREFKEELGSPVTGEVIPLKPLRQPSRKIIYAWGLRGDYDPVTLKSNTFTMEWPPKSGQHREFPEVDRAAWFQIEDAKRKIHRGQVPLIEELVRLVSKNVYMNEKGP
jgi:predicted NUDIX family NTP pyrophosphohydrolase